MALTYVGACHPPLPMHTCRHEFVGIVEACDAAPALVGARVVGEINCNDARHADADAIAQRNHAPGRSVLGIIGRDGCFAQFCALPASNLLRVPQALTDAQAAFAEPLAAACRLLEQQLLDPEPQSRQTVAVLGDGRLGLLIAAVAALHAPGRVTHFGRHEAKLGLVKGTAARIIVGADTAARYAGTFDLVVEASGACQGWNTALHGSLLFASTCRAFNLARGIAPVH
jgi:threonine dehydrogenase-like Zn-dependent dehydrogenase